MAEYICSSCGCTIESEADPQGKIRGRLRIGGIPWPEGKTARIAFSAFDASGAGGRYPVLRKLSASHSVLRTRDAVALLHDRDAEAAARIRKSFARSEEVQDMPHLLEIQKNSYKWF